MTRALLGAAHPVPAVAVTLLATALTAAAGQPAGRTVLCAAMVLTGQLSIGWSNDALDRDRDAAAGRSDKPVARGAVPSGLVWRAAFGALAVSVGLSLVYGVVPGALHLVLVAAGWVYNLGVKATAWSWVPYAAGFGALPGFAVLGVPGASYPPAWATAAGALLGVGAHAANVLPDIADDLAAGVRGLPQRLGPRGAALLAAAALLSASLALLIGPPGAVTPAALAALGLVAAVLTAGLAAGLGRTGRSRGPFFAAIAVAACDVVLLIARGTTLG